MEFKKRGKVVNIKHHHAMTGATDLHVALEEKDGTDESVTLSFSSKTSKILHQKGFPLKDKDIRKEDYMVTITIKSA